VLLAAVVLPPPAAADPRDELPARDIAATAAWLRANVRAGDALYLYSPVFLDALPAASVATALPPRLQGTARAATLQLYATSTEGTSPHRSSSR
jgi:hypothetical protein